MEYQGANNWDGLLDPLDDTLRSEIVRYGEFVQAAYTCFDFDPSSPSYATCRFTKNSLLRRSGLPFTGYRVTRNLHATSGIRLPRWARASSTWLSRRSSWIGYVAVCQDEDEIARLGRRDIVVSFRGTATCLEWLENIRATLTHLPCPFPPSASQPEPMEEETRGRGSPWSPERKEARARRQKAAEARERRWTLVRHFEEGWSATPEGSV